LWLNTPQFPLESFGYEPDEGGVKWSAEFKVFSTDGGPEGHIEGVTGVGYRRYYGGRRRIWLRTMQPTREALYAAGQRDFAMFYTERDRLSQRECSIPSDQWLFFTRRRHWFSQYITDAIHCGRREESALSDC